MVIGNFSFWTERESFQILTQVSLFSFLPIITDEDWTQAETDYLMDLCVSYDLRFVVIQDRYDWPGGNQDLLKYVHLTFHPSHFLSNQLLPFPSLPFPQDLKSRYYAICRRLIRSRISAEDLESRQALVNTYLFDPKEKSKEKRGS